jgi:hypothetical protein
MNRATLVYFAVIIASAAGLWAILGAGQELRAPTDLSGAWVVGGEDPAVPAHLGESVEIEQSGRFVQLNFARGLRVDVKLKDQPAKVAADENLDLVFEGPRWKLTAFGPGADGPLIFRLTGPERHTFTVTRQGASNAVPNRGGVAGAGVAAGAVQAAASATAIPPAAEAPVASSETEDVGVAADSADAP